MWSLLTLAPVTLAAITAAMPSAPPVVARYKNDTSGDICSADPQEASSWLDTGAAQMVDDYVSEHGEGMCSVAKVG